MSYILEALKESQRSRDEQQVPDIMTVHGIPEPEHEQPAHSRWIMPLVLLVCVAAAAGWWFAGSKQIPDDTAQPVAIESQPERTEPESTEPLVVQSAEPVETVTSKPVPAELKAVEPETAPVTATVPATVRTTKPVLPAPAQQSVSPQPLDEPIEPPPVVEPVVSLPEKVAPKAVVIAEKIPPAVQEEKAVIQEDVTPVTVASQVQDKKVAMVEPVVEQVAPVPSSTQETALQDAPVEEPASESVAESPEPERVPHFRELPYEVQQAVSGVKYSVHLYSPDPSRRLVKINGIVRREGSEVSPGLVLDKVTPDGAIFTYREYRFRVPVR